MHFCFDTGHFDDRPAQSIRTLGELASIFAGFIGDPEQVVYETHGCPGEVEGPPRLLYSTTVIHPGDVEGEFFMTRGHFHTNSERGELVLTLRGTGALILMDRERKTWTELMEPGSLHDIDGRHAHRVANCGDVPLVFLVAWMSDCGHEYESIRDFGFGKRMFRDRGLV
jgi:glucose-6-phosphate isomerase